MKYLRLLSIVAIVFLTNTSYRPASTNFFRILIDKSEYELSVYDEQGWLVSYPVVFGNKDQGDKLYEGDRRTPIGTYRIVNKKPHPKWHSYMGLDYPTQADLSKFKQRKQAGVIPAKARIGGGIGIHGTWPNEDFAVDEYQNWTLGCISLKNNHMEELFKMTPLGTPVTIQP